MSNTLVSQYTKIYEVDDATPASMIIDTHLTNLTITTQPLNIPIEDVDLIETEPKGLLTETNAIGKATMTGTVTLSARPIGTFEQFH